MSLTLKAVNQTHSPAAADSNNRLVLTWLKDILMFPGSNVSLLWSPFTRSLNSLKPVFTSTA